MSSPMLFVTVSTILLVAACTPQSTPAGFPLLINTPSPAAASPPVLSTAAPAPQPLPPAADAAPPLDCDMFSSPAPTLPGTDCLAWDMLYSLVLMTNMMADKDQLPTPSEIVTLETEIYPLFVQAQSNCQEWVEPYNDYEPITDYLAFLSAIGRQEYDYDPAALLLYLIEAASTRESAATSASIGCTKNLFLLFVAYSE